MIQSQVFAWAVAVSALLAASSESAWKAKPINQWSADDALQVLANSPWAKNSVGVVSGLQTEDERRDGGNMGQDHGAGYDGVDPKSAKPSFADVIRGGSAGVDTRRASRPIKLLVRWESALPIRAAEFKAGVIEPPTLEGDGYQIAVYGVPGTFFKKDPTALGKPLRKEAALKREGKKDVKPFRVEVFQRENDLVVVFLFPISAELTASDQKIDFAAQIGRIAVLQRFNAAEMLFQGRLEL